MRDFEVTIKLRNNQLKARRMKLGLTQKQLAVAAGVPVQVYGALENLAVSPTYAGGGTSRRQGEWRRCVLDLATFFGCEPEQLFPPSVSRIKKTTIILEFDESQLPIENTPMLLPSAEESLIKRDERAALKTALAALDPRQRSMIEQNYGLNGTKALTLDEIGQQYGLSKERVRQIILKGIKRLRHYSTDDGTFLEMPEWQDKPDHGVDWLIREANTADRAAQLLEDGVSERTAKSQLAPYWSMQMNKEDLRRANVSRRRAVKLRERAAALSALSDGNEGEEV